MLTIINLENLRKFEFMPPSVEELQAVNNAHMLILEETEKVANARERIARDREKIHTRLIAGQAGIAEQSTM